MTDLEIIKRILGKRGSKMDMKTEEQKIEMEEVRLEEIPQNRLVCERVHTEGKELPGDCGKYVGTLDYYMARREDFLKRHPDRESPEYYIKHGDNPSRKFMEETMETLSPKGRVWLERTFINLQKAIEKKRRSDPESFDCLELDDREFTTFAYSTHSGTYIKAGFSELPAGDIIKITRTIGLTSIITRDGLKQTAILALSLLRSIIKKAFKSLFRVIKGKRK
jgi:hypothetical protein